MAMYKKREGTSGIRGQLYETKLLSLLLFRAQHDKNVEEIYLASNMDEAGAFDDICFKVKIKGIGRPLVVFIQAKHRENSKTGTLCKKNNLVKYFESYLKIKEKFDATTDDEMFNESFDEIESLFVIYTTEKGDENNIRIKNSCVEHLNRLIATGEIGTQPIYNDSDVRYLSNIIIKSEVAALGERFAKMLHEKATDKMMSDEYILRYHVILANRVLNISEIDADGYRNAKFRFEFFDSTDEFVMALSDTLFPEVIKKPFYNTKVVNEALSTFLLEPAVDELSCLIGHVVTYENGKFKFVIETSENFKEILDGIQLPLSSIKKAINKAVSTRLRFLKFKLPAAFGNIDLKLRGSQNKIEKRLNYIANSVVDLVTKSKPRNIVIIDETLGDGLLQLNGGLGSAVGNILVYDEHSKLLKFTDDSTLLQNHAKKLFEKLKSRINNMHEYRFQIRSRKLPIVSLDIYDEVVRDFLNVLVFYTNQADESEVEYILKKEIEDHQSDSVHNVRIKSDAIFLKYHDVIQKWWMSPKEAQYFTKIRNLYEETVNNIEYNTLVSITSMMYVDKINAIDFTFSENAKGIFKSLDTSSRTVIISNITVLTVLKLTQYLHPQRYIVLDLHYIFKMSTNDFIAFNSELKQANDKDIIIIIGDNLQNIRYLNNRFQQFVEAVDEYNLIVITNDVFVKTVEEYVPRICKEFNDLQHSLADLNITSQKNIVKNTPVIFQGQGMSLDLLIGDEALAYVEGDVFAKVILNKTISIGESLSSSYYEDIRNIHIDRRVYRRVLNERQDSSRILRTFNDIDDDVVVITAKPGMGKSTLLTHLSFKTKEVDQKLWIVRINLLDHSVSFYKWQKDKTLIDTLEALKFICEVILRSKIKEKNKLTICLRDNNGEVCLQNCTGDKWATFELAMFLHFYNKGKVIFLFDGFDEICPHYVREVISLLNSVKNTSKKHKMWITSRSYNHIQTILQENFGVSYEMDYFRESEKELYLEKFWQSMLILDELNDQQLDNVNKFKHFVIKSLEELAKDKFMKINNSLNLPLVVVYCHLEDYLRNTTKHLQCKSTQNYTLSFVTSLDYLSSIVIALTPAISEGNKIKALEVSYNFIGIPLHLYLIAEYIVNEIKYGKHIDKWDLDISTYSIYQRFLEAKLKKIRFQDKNNMDVYNPDIDMTYKRERAVFIKMHKKLAAYAIFQRKSRIFSRKELKEIMYLIKAIKKGSEKSGLICSVSKNIPQFIHFSFTEYFAMEYISDLLKSGMSVERKRDLWSLILHAMKTNFCNGLDILKIKLETDVNLAKTVKHLTDI